ncbi:MAG TPA: hypothetical protein VKE69_13305 [Planctomycetota bacterium]|nr:hypothetical protein [Planctomycetota bacterium]
MIFTVERADGFTGDVAVFDMELRDGSWTFARCALRTWKDVGPQFTRWEELRHARVRWWDEDGAIGFAYDIAGRAWGLLRGERMFKSFETREQTGFEIPADWPVVELTERDAGSAFDIASLRKEGNEVRFEETPIQVTDSRMEKPVGLLQHRLRRVDATTALVNLYDHHGTSGRSLTLELSARDGAWMPVRCAARVSWQGKSDLGIYSSLASLRGRVQWWSRDGELAVRYEVSGGAATKPEPVEIRGESVLRGLPAPAAPTSRPAPR